MSAEITDLVVVIIAGGVGTRFWPLSTPQLPKQFIRLDNGLSLFQSTLERAKALVPREHIYVVSRLDQQSHIYNQAPELPEDNIIFEPQGKDTAPAIILAAKYVENRHPGAILVLMPSDHLIQGMKGFIDTLSKAFPLASKDKLLTIGIPPTYPATEFGYLELSGTVDRQSGAILLKRFVEKPALETAIEFRNSGNFLWNSGMLVGKAAVILSKSSQYAPEIYQKFTDIDNYILHDRLLQELPGIYAELPRISYDYAVLEHCHEVWTIPASFQWSDLGGWLAFQETLSPDQMQNYIQGQVYLTASSQNLIVNEDKEHPILCIGIQNQIVVSGKAGVFVCTKDTLSQAKSAIQQIIEGGFLSPFEYRPWGFLRF